MLAPGSIPNDAKCAAGSSPLLTCFWTNVLCSLLFALCYKEFGYVIVAPRACDVGCIDKENRKDLPHDPPGFGLYYTQQLKGIEWAKNMTAARDPMFTRINWAGGVGVAGHSMGESVGSMTACAAHHEGLSRFRAGPHRWASGRSAHHCHRGRWPGAEAGAPGFGRSSSGQVAKRQCSLRATTPRNTTSRPPSCTTRTPTPFPRRR